MASIWYADCLTFFLMSSDVGNFKGMMSIMRYRRNRLMLVEAMFHLLFEVDDSTKLQASLMLTESHRYDDMLHV